MSNVRTAYLSLGANLGNREETLRKAVQRLAAAEGIEMRKRRRSRTRSVVCGMNTGGRAP